MKQLYLDLACGAAGDMLLAALIDAGADFNEIMIQLRKLPLADWDMTREKTVRSGISASYINVIDNSASSNSHAHHHNHAHYHKSAEESDHTHEHHHADPHDHEHKHDHSHHHEHCTETEVEHGHSEAEHHLEHDHAHGHDHHHEGPHRYLKDMLELLDSADLPQRAKQRASDVFTLIAQAEGKVHGKPPTEVHFHEVSGIDTMIDVTGVCLALELLEVEHVYASKVATGSGHVHCAHGTMPVPAPATQEILLEAGIPYQSGPVEKELLTPTGAALLAVICDDFCTLPEGKALGVGYGAGKADFPNYPNTVRAILYDNTSEQLSEPVQSDTVIEIRASIDDMTGEEAGELLNDCYRAGALEAYYLPAIMKKSRPGFEMVAICTPAMAEKIEYAIFKSGATLGLRKRQYQRSILRRKEITVDIDGHAIHVKAGYYANDLVSLKAEYSDCHHAAQTTGMPFREIRQKATACALHILDPENN